MTGEPELFHFRISHFNEKVRWALDHKAWPHRRTALVPGFHIPRARWLSGANNTPLLKLDGRVIADSTEIIAELERRKPDPALYPSDPDERARALAIEDYFDEEVAPELRRLFWAAYIEDPDACARMATDGSSAATRWLWRTMFPVMLGAFRGSLGLNDELLAAARTRLAAHIDRLESEIGPSGYLVGDRFSIADLGAAAVMTAILRPPEFPYPLPEPWPVGLRELRDSVVDRAGCQWVMDMYRRHRAPSAAVSG